MNKLIKRVENFINNYDIKGTILVAFSGGADSLCLLDITKKVYDDIIAIHLNHNWRGEYSRQDELNCQLYCKKNNIKFYSETLDSSVSQTETAAREARYAFFERCAKKFDSKVIFTAHNKNDNAETILYRIIKGTGIIGLEGIKEHRDIYYRPLLTTERRDIDLYCNENNLIPNIDNSNFDTKYKRNFIRHEILTKAEEINKNTLDALNTLSQIAIESNQIIDEYLDNIYKKLKFEKKIKTNEYLKLSKAIQKRIIYNLFQEHNLDYDNAKINRINDFILANTSSKSGISTSLNNKLQLFVNNKFINVISNQRKEDFSLKITKTGEYKTPFGIFIIEECNNTQDIKKNDESYVFAQLNEINFTLRTRLDGDIIQPLGMSGKQKLKKYLNEKKIPKYEKDSILLLAKDNEIFWIAGYGVSEKIKACEHSTHILKFIRNEGKND